jgi:hypothetical protein
MIHDCLCWQLAAEWRVKAFLCGGITLVFWTGCFLPHQPKKS